MMMMPAAGSADDRATPATRLADRDITTVWLPLRT
jgi:hypothetical protein